MVSWALEIGPPSRCFQKAQFSDNIAYLAAVNSALVHFIACMLILLPCFWTMGVVGEELKLVLIMH